MSAINMSDLGQPDGSGAQVRQTLVCAPHANLRHDIPLEGKAKHDRPNKNIPDKQSQMERWCIKQHILVTT